MAEPEYQALLTQYQALVNQVTNGLNGHNGLNGQNGLNNPAVDNTTSQKKGQFGGGFNYMEIYMIFIGIIFILSFFLVENKTRYHYIIVCGGVLFVSFGIGLNYSRKKGEQWH